MNKFTGPNMIIGGLTLRSIVNKKQGGPQVLAGPKRGLFFGTVRLPGAMPCGVKSFFVSFLAIQKRKEDLT